MRHIQNIHLTTKYFVKVNRLGKVIKEREHFLAKSLLSKKSNKKEK